MERQTGPRLEPLQPLQAEQRAAALPDVPTTTEAGFVDSDYEFWVGAFAPSATSREIVDRLNRQIAKALETPGVRERLKNLGGSPTPMAVRAFEEQFKREVAVNAKLVKAVGLAN